jgi:hypothetical protein
VLGTLNEQEKVPDGPERLVHAGPVASNAATILEEPG